MAGNTLWPVNYPVEAVAAFDPRGAPNCIILQMGDHRRVVTAADLHGNICVELPTGVRGTLGALGYVHISCINIGNTRRVTEGPQIQFQESSFPDLSRSLYIDPVDIFTQTVTGLLSGMYEHREDFPISPTYVENALST